jgi:hypothetical protein
VRGETSHPAEIIAEALTVRLGPSTARTAVRTFSSRALGLRPDQVSAADAPRLLDALRPMLRTLLGPGDADDMIAGVRGNLGSTDRPPAAR